MEPEMQAWNSFSPQEMNCSSKLTSDCLLNPYFDKHSDHFTHFQSDLSSVVSSPAAPTSSILNEAIGIREFGNLGPVCSSSENPSLFSSGTGLAPARNFHGSGFSISKEIVEGNLPNFANSLALNLPLTTLSNDPEFAERINSIGNRNNCTLRRSHSAVNDTELPYSATDMMTFWGSPSLQQGGSQMGYQNSSHTHTQKETQKSKELTPIPPNSNESSSISEQVPSGVTVSQTSNEMNSTKRKAVSKSKAIKHVSPKAVNSQQAVEEDDTLKGKRRKTAETNSSRKGGINKEEATVKSDDPPKDYIHVRARRGQATDNHSLAERVRREKIGERMKLLQDLVPGCNKVTGKALMLDEIINYVQSLQRQVEFLSMKLASVDPRKEVTSKTIIQQNGQLPDSLYTKDFNISSSFYGHHHLPKQSALMNINASLSQCVMEPVYKPSYHNLESQLPQFPGFGEDDLHSIVRMGLGQNSNKKQRFNQ